MLDAVTRLEGRWEKELAGVEFAVEEVPPAASDVVGDPVPLARSQASVGGKPARIVVYRRPAQARAEGDDELATLIFDVVVEEVARLLGVDPETVDPGYSDDDQ